MKFRMMLSALLLAVGLVFVTGCGKKADAKKAEAKAETPTEVAKKALEAMNKMDFDTFVALSDGKQQEEAKKMAEEFKQIKERADKGDAQAKRQLESIQTASAGVTFEIKGEKIEGDFAEVEFTIIPDGKGKIEKMYFKKVNGQWKAIANEDYKPAK